MTRKIGLLQRHRILLSAGVYLICIVAVSYATLTRTGRMAQRPPLEQGHSDPVTVPASPPDTVGQVETNPAGSARRPDSARAQAGDVGTSSSREGPFESAEGSIIAIAPDSGPASSEEADPRVPDDGTLRIPLAKMGIPATRSALESSPGYTPPDDPESASSVTGRREAPLIDAEFSGGADSPEDLARRILAALRARDRQALQSLRVLPGEFEEVLWPEFPQSRPITNLVADDAYFFIDRSCLAGVSQGLADFGGQELRLDRIEYEIGKKIYRNFTIYDGVVIHATAPGEIQVAIRFAPAFAERHGIWKVYIYKD